MDPPASAAATVVVPLSSLSSRKDRHHPQQHQQQQQHQEVAAGAAAGGGVSPAIPQTSFIHGTSSATEDEDSIIMESSEDEDFLDEETRPLPSAACPPSLSASSSAASSSSSSSKKNNKTTTTTTRKSKSSPTKKATGGGGGNNTSTSGLFMSAADVGVFQQLDAEYDRAMEEREVAYSARYNSVRQSACFAVTFMILYMTLGTLYFMQQTDWTMEEALFFGIYTITTVGYGNLENPETPAFQIYTVFFILVGIATLTIMVAQVYQCIALEAGRAQHSRDHLEMRRRGLDIHAAARQRRTKQRGGGGTESAAAGGGDEHNNNIVSISELTTSTDTANANANANANDTTTAHETLNHHFSLPLLDFCFRCFDQCRYFLKENEFGRGLSVLFPFLTLIAVGAIVVGSLEQWTAVESIYFAVVSLTTVGFGDYFPTRTSSRIFCIIWLPFSVGFMSLYLGNIAAFYIRLSDRNIARIERQLRRKIDSLKQRSEREKEEARRRALRGQLSDHPPPRSNSSTGGVLGDSMGTRPAAVASSSSAHHHHHHHHNQERRTRVLQNHLGHGKQHQSALGDAPESTSTMATMKHVIDAVHANMRTTPQAFGAGPESEYLSYRSSKVVSKSSLEQKSESVRKPSFALRVLVQERFAEIIATDVAGFQNEISIQEATLSVTIESLKNTAEKWLIPRRARRAFRAVSFEALYFVGEHGLITRGANALYQLNPFEFHGLFAPLLASLGDADAMEAWLGDTESMAHYELQNNNYNNTNLALAAAASIPRASQQQQQQQQQQHQTQRSSSDRSEKIIV